MKIKLFFLVALVVMPYLCLHGRSEKMEKDLNAPPPAWLSIGKPIKIQPLDGKNIKNIVFRSLDEGVVNSRNRVKIPAQGIEFEVDYFISWFRGTSLSPDGKKLIVNSRSLNTHLYELMPNRAYREVKLRLPKVTYDEGSNGYLREWSWVDNKTLVASCEITDYSGDRVIENRLYVFFTKEQVLSRLDLSALNLSATDALGWVEVIKVGSHLKHLVISVGEKKFTVKADLKSPPIIENEEKVLKRASVSPSFSDEAIDSSDHKSKGLVERTNSSEDSKKNIKVWLLIASGVIVLGILILRFKSDQL